MNTQKLIEAIKSATKQFYIGWPVYDTVKYIDADAFLAAVERVAAAENLEAERVYFNKMNWTD